MRYRIGQEPSHSMGQPVGEDGLTIFTAVFSLLTGLIFIIAGIKGRQRWLMFWGGGLVLASLAYLGSLFV
jgi:hypothetical protein